MKIEAMLSTTGILLFGASLIEALRGGEHVFQFLILGWLLLIYSKQHED